MIFKYRSFRISVLFSVFIYLAFFSYLKLLKFNFSTELKIIISTFLGICDYNIVFFGFSIVMTLLIIVPQGLLLNQLENIKSEIVVRTSPNHYCKFLLKNIVLFTLILTIFPLTFLLKFKMSLFIAGILFFEIVLGTLSNIIFRRFDWGIVISLILVLVVKLIAQFF